ncbi:hypothetical protein KQI88_12100 [Alkaliphilus sp. MSJ-5]|uniref:CopZ zinc binding domain-containing protein n=1 Tax=Alkaliphilus flagellatus TaxID=2841507 RepID=A0ABS6G3U7_9FIRM|nr:hypothetical protein [Alkaliphilus flagellatus]MBU5677154.1 hypothetical protein [Alkaliphilus flagellatus]
MGCCKGIKRNKQENKKSCPLCNTLGNNIHYLAVEMVVKEDIISEVTKEDYFVCINNSCDAVFYNESGNRIFLAQDINMGANFDEVTKQYGCKCNSDSKCGSCNNK